MYTVTNLKFSFEYSTYDVHLRHKRKLLGVGRIQNNGLHKQINS